MIGLVWAVSEAPIRVNLTGFTGGGSGRLTELEE